MKNIKSRCKAIVIGCLAMHPHAILHAETYYFHTDHLGTPHSVTNSSQQIAWQAEYSPFGEVTETINTVEQNLRFTGQYLDRETGLHYNYFRFYSPSTGRYLRSDPVGMVAGLDRYSYVNNNPLRANDPFGLFEIRGYPIKTRDGLVDKFAFDFNPISENAISAASQVGRLTNRGAFIIKNLFSVEPAGPKRAFRDYFQCGILDVDLALDFEELFPEGGRLNREQAELFLEQSRDKYPDFSDLYASPKSLLDTASENGRNHFLNSIIIQGGNY